jgi:hypothetical protein
VKFPDAEDSNAALSMSDAGTGLQSIKVIIQRQ